MHHDNYIQEQHAKRKPEIVKFYNKTKGGVEVKDQLVRNYTCKYKLNTGPWHCGAT